MKLGYDAKRAFLNTSGLGNYSRNALNALHKYYPQNEYVLFTPEAKIGMLKQQEQFSVIAPPKSMSKIGKSCWRTFRLSKTLEAQQIDLFHGLSNELPQGIHKTRIPSVVTIHDLIFLRYPEFYKLIDRKIYARKIKYACRVATKIIAISEQTKSDIVQFTGTDPKKIEVVHQTISPLFFETADTETVKAKYKLPDRFIVAVGNIEERKNQLSIIKALQAKNMDLPLVLVGNPTSYCNDIHKYLAANQLKDRVRFLKNIPEKDLAALYQLAELSVYISVFEGFGLPVIEAMACGCPVITSNVSCLPETAGGAALLCSPNNEEELAEKIDKIMTDNDLRKKLIEKGTQRANEFRAENYASRLMNLYAGVIN